MTDVTQADRDAAADYLHGDRSAIEVGASAYFQAIRDGDNDDNRLVQAFARRGEAERERCASIAENWHKGFPSEHAELAQAIRSQKP
jgi:hypothetical protein